jgi:DNA mismatch repair protein MutS2
MQDRDALARDREAFAAEKTRLLEREAHLAEREAVLKRRLDDRLNEKLREARTEIDRIVGRLKERADVLARQAETRAAQGAVLSTGEVGGLRAEARAALGAMAGAFGTSDAPGDRLTEPPSVGDKVLVASLGAEGVVRDVSHRQIDVDVRGKRLRVTLADLRRPATAAARRNEPRERRGAPSGVHVQAAARGDQPTPDLVLVGSTVDDAIDRASKFIDDALLADERRLRVVHGHGTGRLREALTRYFREHPLVARVSLAPENEGGNGATIVELKD